MGGFFLSEANERDRTRISLLPNVASTIGLISSFFTGCLDTAGLAEKLKSTFVGPLEEIGLTAALNGVLGVFVEVDGAGELAKLKLGLMGALETGVTVNGVDEPKTAVVVAAGLSESDLGGLKENAVDVNGAAVTGAGVTVVVVGVVVAGAAGFTLGMKLFMDELRAPRRPAGGFSEVGSVFAGVIDEV